MALSFMGLLITLLALVIFSLSTSTHYGVEAAGRSISTSPNNDEELELERDLMILNKPAVKTIQTEEGDIFDCVDVYRQPAFDNPRLKNHKIQMNPPSILTRTTDEKMAETSSSLYPSASIQHIPCPKGTVPIRRTSKEDLRRSRSFSQSYNPSISRPHSELNDGQYRAYRRTIETQQIHYDGVQGDLDVATPNAEHDQVSAALIMVEASSPDIYDSIQAGWAVAPSLFRDNRTRIFAYWTQTSRLGGLQGCYNILCPGFVQVHGQVPLGAYIDKTSIYGGPQYRLRYTIVQDKDTRNWWLCLNDKEIKIGYWPKELFEILNPDHYNRVALGGYVKGNPDGPSPPMGKGHFPDHEFTRSCYVQHMNVKEYRERDWREPYEATEFDDFVDASSDCYQLENIGRVKDKGVSFLFGGPGAKGHCD